MAVYEFRCRACGARVGVQRPFGQPDPPAACEVCGHTSFGRVYSGIAFAKSEASRLEAIDLSRPPDPSFYRDSRNVGLRTQARLAQMGVDLGDRFRETVETARSGELVEAKARELDQ